MPTVQTFDESTLGDQLMGPSIEITADEVSVAELICIRVRAEVDRYNADRPEKFYGLIQPTDTEAFLNGPIKRRFKPINPDVQVKVALDAFDRQRFLVLLPGGQAKSLDQMVSLREGDQVSFLRLVPLIGG